MDQCNFKFVKHMKNKNKNSINSNHHHHHYKSNEYMKEEKKKRIEDSESDFYALVMSPSVN